jgi:hypothetical protein
MCLNSTINVNYLQMSNIDMNSINNLKAKQKKDTEELERKHKKELEEFKKKQKKDLEELVKKYQKEMKFEKK